MRKSIFFALVLLVSGFRGALSYASVEDLSARIEYSQNDTSDQYTIMTDTLTRFGMELGSFGDRILIAWGGITDNEEMLSRAYDALESRNYDKELIRGFEGDSETFTAKTIESIANLTFLLGTGVISCGIIPLVYICINVISDSIYNNQKW